MKWKCKHPNCNFIPDKKSELIAHSHFDLVGDSND